MGKRQRMITDEIICSTRFLNLPMDAQLLYFYLMLYSDDDGIVDAFPVMKMAGHNQGALKALIEDGFIYLLNDNSVSFIIHWHAQNTISPSRKIDSQYLRLLIEKHPEMSFKIVVCKNKKYEYPFSKELEKIRDMEMKPKNLPNEINKLSNELKKEKTSSLSKKNEVIHNQGEKAISMPMEMREKWGL